VRVGHNDDELARLRCARHQRMAKFEQIGRVGKILPADDLAAGFRVRVP